MIAETEAECLLRSGSLYRQRAGLRFVEDRLVFVGVKRGAFSLYDGDEPIFHFDLDGRWQRAYIAGTHYRKALEGSIDAIERPRVGGSLVLSRRRLPFAEATDLDESIRQVALDWLARLGMEKLEIEIPGNATALTIAELRDLLHRAGRWDSDAWFAQRERYLATYAPLDFLPPDDHQSLVLQATIGDRAFSGIDADQSASRTADEFRVHCRSVRTLLGRRLAQCRDVFLGGCSAIRENIDAYFQIACDEFSIVGSRDAKRQLAPDEAELGTINLFLDDFRPGLPDRAGWERLKTLHLGRVNLGVVTGDDELRNSLRLGGSAADVARAVDDLRALEIDVALIVHLGVGGPSHVASTIEFIRSLDLSRRDFIYLIDAGECGIPVQDTAEIDEQRNTFKDGLLPLRKASGVKIVPYSIDKQWN